MKSELHGSVGRYRHATKRRRNGYTAKVSGTLVGVTSGAGFPRSAGKITDSFALYPGETRGLSPLVCCATMPKPELTPEPLAIPSSWPSLSVQIPRQNGQDCANTDEWSNPVLGIQKRVRFTVGCKGEKICDAQSGSTQYDISGSPEHHDIGAGSSMS